MTHLPMIPILAVLRYCLIIFSLEYLALFLNYYSFCLFAAEVEMMVLLHSTSSKVADQYIIAIMENYNMDFAHFDNEEITEKFITYLNTINVSVNHRCCNGKGVAILNYNNDEINQFINNFWNRI
jgi:hypothetical protein